MKDKRIKNLAQVAVEYSSRVKKGDLVLIRGNAKTKDIILELYRQVLEKGAHPITQIVFDEMSKIYYDIADKEQLEYITPYETINHDKIDVSFGIWGGGNTKQLFNVDKKKQALFFSTRKHLQERNHKMPEDGGIRWVVVPYPSPFLAQDANMSNEEYEDFVFGCCMVDQDDPLSAWENLRKEQAEIVKHLQQFKEFHIKGLNVDLKFHTRDRNWVSCDGMVNLPDGEIYTCPFEDSLEGFINFTYPGFYAGQEVNGVKLEFKKGKVSNFSSETKMDFLKEMIELDEGSNMVGELAFGTNKFIDRYTRNILFDEKIGGTMHIALGNSAIGTNGSIRSGIHWDLITHTNKETELYGDGILLYKDGKFIK